MIKGIGGLDQCL